MKKIGIKIVSVVLVMSLIFSGFSAMGTASAADVGKTLKNFGVSIVDGIITTLITGINLLVPDSKDFVKAADRNTENFYTGTESMINEPAANAAWKLGHAKASLVPGDWQTKDYYLGGFMAIENGMSNKVEEVIDDMQVRVIAVEDGSGRGVSIFANIDAIGVSNGDIKEIRKLVEKMNLGVKINSINVSSTHCHSCIDTQGLWTNLFPKLLKNMALAYIPFLDKEHGVDMDYMTFLYNKVAETMKTAVEGMTEGKMTYAVKDIGDKYFNNKNRTQATACISEMSRFIFTPFDSSIKPTMIVSIAAHPDVAGLAVSDEDNGRDLSGDYVYYLGDEIEKGGYNFMFFNGPIAGIYEDRGPTGDNVPTDRRYQQSERFGREMGKIALNLTNTKEYISQNADWETINKEMELGGEHYSLWFEEWEPATERELKPVLNILLKEVKIPVTNPLIQLVGKLNLVNYTVCKDGFKYCIFAEIGYMEMGDVKVVFMPGEIVQDLVAGGASLTADGSYTGKDFGYKTIYELFGNDTVCFGLMNDAIGYVVPDNDYSMAILDNHYQELISLGKYAGSSIMKGFEEIAAEVNK